MTKSSSCHCCGYPLSQMDAFCPQCGTSSNPNASLPTTVIPNRLTAHTPVTPPGHRFTGSDIARIIAALIAAVALIITALVGGPKLFILLNPPASPTSASSPSTPTTGVEQATGNTRPTISVPSPQQLYTQITGRTPDLQESFISNDSNAWDVTPQNQTAGCAFRGGSYHAYTRHPGETECFAHVTNFANFALQVEMTTVIGEGGGLIIRADSTNTQKEYRFYVSPGTYCDLFVPLNGYRYVCENNPGSAINQGPNQMNTIMVIASGNTIYLYINGHYLGTAVDGTSSVGEIGVFAAQFKSAPTEVFFSNLKVWIL